jgi:hypothetical protein
MADWLVLQRWQGYLNGRRFRFIPGQILDDEQDPVDDAIANGAAIVAYDPATMAVAVERFSAARNNDPKFDQTMIASLEREGGLPSTVANLASITANQAAIAAIQARTSKPEIDILAPAVGPTLAVNGTENLTIEGTDLVQGQAFASLTLGASLDIIAEVPGSAGNAFSVEVVDTGGAGPSTVAYAAGKLTIDLVGLTPNEDAIAALVNAGGGAWTGILRANSGAGPAFGTAVEANLAGGSGSGLAVLVGGEACSPVGESGGLATSTASYTDTSLSVDVPDLSAAGLAANETATVRVVSNGESSLAGSLVLA